MVDYNVALLDVYHELHKFKAWIVVGLRKDKTEKHTLSLDTMLQAVGIY